MTFAFNGIKDTTITLPAGEGAAAGNPAVFNENGEVVNAANGDTYFGLITDVRDGVAAVQIGGCIRFLYLGVEPTPGYCQLAAFGKGNITVSSTAGRSQLVLKVEPSSRSVWVMM